jgi:uncharacterized protein YkwD
MTKQKSKIISKHPVHRRSTFKKHSKHYAKVYSPYLPAIIGLVVGLGLLLPWKEPPKSVLSYATSTSVDTLLEETNQRRADNDAGELLLNESLSAAARSKARDMAEKDYWSHETPDGKQPWYFIDRTGYQYSQAAENLAYGFNSSKDTVNGWMNSPQHRKAMLDNNLSEVGFGIVNTEDFQGQGPESIVVAIYAQNERADPSMVNSSFVEKPAKTISFGQVLTGGNSPWINLIAGIAIGVIGMYLVAKHSLKLRRKLRQGERYVLRHPVLDVSLISLLVVLIALSKTAGFIQ